MKGLRELMCETVVKGGSVEDEFTIKAFNEGYTISAIQGFIDLYIVDARNRFVKGAINGRNERTQNANRQSKERVCISR